MSRRANGVVVVRGDLTPELAQVDERLFDLATRYLGVGAYEDDGFVPTETALDALTRDVDAALASLRSCHVPAGLDAVAAHLHECGAWLRVTIDDDRDYPVNPLRAWIAAMQQRLFPIDAGDDADERSRFLLARLGGADAYLSALVDGAERAPAAHLEHCHRRLAPFIADLERGAAAVTDLPRGDELVTALHAASAAVRRCSERLASLIESPREVVMGRRYEEVVRQKFGFDLDAIRGWCDDDLGAVRERLGTAIGGSGPAALERMFATLLTPYPDASTLRADAEIALRRAREIAAARVTLPPGERLVLDDVPDTDRDKLPFGAYSGGRVLRGDVRGRWLVNLANLRGLHRGWVWMMALHEGYPGHHVHYAKTAASDDLPLTFRLPGYGPAQGLIEGVAHRSEAYLETFDDQRSLWPMVHYRQLQTLLRIKTQLMISVESTPLQEAVAVYTSELGMDAATAGALVRSQTMNPGRTFSYYTGMRTLREAQGRMSADDAPFTEAIFSNGFVSLATMQSLLDARFGWRQEPVTR